MNLSRTIWIGTWVLAAATPAAWAQAPAGDAPQSKPASAAEEADARRMNRPGGGEAPTGLFFVFEGLSMEPGDLALHVANVDSVAPGDPLDTNADQIPDNFLYGGSARRSELEFDRKTDLRGEIGWNFHGWRSLSVRFWRHDDSAEVSGASQVDTPLGELGGVENVLGSLAPQQDLQFNRPTSFFSRGDLTAQTLDFLFRKNVPCSKRWDLEWNFGLRALKFEQQTTTVYRAESIPLVRDPLGKMPVNYQTVTFDNSTNGLGPLGGARGIFRFGKKGAVRADFGIDIGLVYGDNDLSYEDVNDLDANTVDPLPPGEVDPPPPPQQLARIASTKQDRVITTLETSVGVSYHFKERFFVRAGWSWFRWYDVQTREVFQDIANPASTIPDVSDASFQGGTVGFGIAF